MIFLPVELEGRDLLGRFYLAFAAARTGDYFAIGRHDVLWPLVSLNPGCVYVGKHVFLQCGRGGDAARLKSIRELDVRHIWLDDEGLAAFHDVDGGESFWAARCDPSLFGDESCVAVWGDRQYRWHRERIDSRVPVVVTGHPRLELSRPQYASYFEPEIQHIKKTFGAFVLINTRFGSVFAMRGFEYNFRHGVVDGAAVSDEQVHAAEFVRAVRSLANAMNDVRFVLRPHPAENINQYRLLFADLANVAVVFEGQVIPWIHASAGVIHNSCTTGIEATLAEKPVISYLPQHLNGAGTLDHRRAVANLTSIVAQTPAQLVEATTAMLTRNIRHSGSRDEAASHLNNLRAAGADALIELIAERRAPRGGEPEIGRRYALGRKLSEPIRWARRELDPARRGETQHGQHECPPLSRSSVQRQADYFAAVTGKSYRIELLNSWYCVLHFDGRNAP
jgi:surface carbohydrate biosynthesis protein